MVNYCYSRGKIKFEDSDSYHFNCERLREIIENPIAIEESAKRTFNDNKQVILIPFGQYINIIDLSEEIIRDSDVGKIVSATMDGSFMGYIDAPEESETVDLYNWVENNSEYSREDLKVSSDDTITQVVEKANKKEQVIRDFIFSNC